ncbi:MAG: hypothetical protein MUF86_14685 [Akkermansiaceae bacterium]|jgi:hypothetical protein|nr:hypothetical protein [Akkermansiaceae bacterium]
MIPLIRSDGIPDPIGQVGQIMMPAKRRAAVFAGAGAGIGRQTVTR